MNFFMLNNVNKKYYLFFCIYYDFYLNFNFNLEILKLALCYFYNRTYFRKEFLLMK